MTRPTTPTTSARGLFRGRVRRVHFIGIGGIGMSGIAEVLLNLGFEVHGSDLRESPTVQRLRRLGATIHLGHAAANIEGTDVVVKSTAVTEDNPEVAEARKNGVPVIPRAEMLAELMQLKHGIAVAGSHGKTTTTSLVAAVLGEAGLDPTVVNGGILNQYGSNARLGQGEHLVAEADESDGSFLRLNPTIAVVTNLDLEHVDYWTGGLDQLKEAFVEFLNRLPFYGLAVVCTDEANVQALLPKVERRVVTYGRSRQADVQARDLSSAGLQTTFTLWMHGEDRGPVMLNTVGAHNVLNALAAIAVAEELGVAHDDVKSALSQFKGVERRFSLRGSVGGVTVIDDYGHHPTEIRATLSAVRLAFAGRRIVVLFQPHRYSRTAALLSDFGRAFNDADLVFITDVYAAGEVAIAGADADSVAAALHEQGHRDASVIGDVSSCAARVLPRLEPGDVVVTLGAGSITGVGPTLISQLEAKTSAQEG